MDIAAFERLINELMNPDNQVRTAAERVYNDTKQTPDLFISLLTQAACRSSNADIRSMSNILLRRVVGKSSETLWGNIQDQTRQLVKSSLLQALGHEEQEVVRTNMSEVIGELGAVLIEEGQWNELLETLFQLTKSPNVDLRVSALEIFTSLASSAGDSLRPHFQVLSELFASGLTDSNIKVAVTSLSAASTLMYAMETQERLAFQQVVPSMLGVVSNALNAKDEDHAKEALEILVDVAGLEPALFKPHLEAVIGGMFALANHTDFEDSVRQLSLEFLITLAENRPAMMRKYPKFIEGIVPILLNLMISIEEDPKWGSSNEEDEVDITNADVGEEDLDRLALALGGKALVPILFGMISQLLANPDWKHRHAALKAISVVGEGCHKQLIENLDQVIKTIVPFLQDSHPRVRWVTCHALGQLSTDFGPDLQNKFHEIVLPGLINEMDDVQNPRVQSHAASAIINFCEHCDAEILQKYLDPLLTKLVALLQTGKTIVQEQAITAIAAVADAARDKFHQYYDTLIPILKRLLIEAPQATEYRMLRGKTIECISLIAVAVGKEKFAADAPAVLEYMIKTQSSISDPDDPQIGFLLQSWARMCRCLKQDFLPYLDHVMPATLKSAKLNADVTVTNEEEEKEGWEYIPIGDKMIGIHTSSLEEKSTACSMIYCYAVELGKGFFKYVEEVAKLFVPLLRFYYHDGVRSAAASTLPCLLTSASEALKESGAQGADQKYVVEMFHFMLPTLLEAMSEESDPEILSTMADSLAESLSLLPDGAINLENTKKIVDTIIGLFNELMDRRNARIKAKTQDDHDAEEEERIEDEELQDDELLSTYQEILGNTAKIVKEVYLEAFVEHIPLFAELVKPNNKPLDRQISLCIFDDLIDHVGKAAFPHVQSFFPLVMNYIGDTDPAVRQAAVYGIGVAVERGGSDFASVIPDIFARLSAVINDPNARSNDYVMATENAISAAGKVVSSGFVNKAELLPLWLSWLPTLEDKVESKCIYKQFVNFFTNDSAILLGNNFANLPKVFEVMGKTLNTDLIEPETRVQYVNILKQLQSTVPANVTQSAFASLAPEIQQALQSI